MRRLMSTVRRTRAASRRVALCASGAAVALTFAVSLAVTTGAAQAVVVTDQGHNYGVALVPWTGLPGGIPPVTSSGPCTDPALPSDLVLPATGLCSHGGSVIHNNETFALTWDPARRYWATTRNFVEQFLSDVARGSGSLSSPYADTTQYTDAGGRAANNSVFGGGCIDYGIPGGFSCQFGNTGGNGAGNPYPANGCTPTGTNQWYEYPGGIYNPTGGAHNDICLTDAQIQSELTTMVPATGMLSHIKPGFAPVVMVLTPPGVVDCLDAGGTLCSFNGASTSQFCSYHSQVNINGIEVPYVVQPWTASWTEPQNDTPPVCDDPSIQSIQPPETVTQLALDVGKRLVSPLSQGHLAAIVNPRLDGWFNNATGAEINDNGCVPFAQNLDQVPVGPDSYFLQREFNNTGVIESDPNALVCTPNILLNPAFVAPSAVNQNDVVQFDGSTTASSLIVPAANYAWNFGDGTTAVGPSVEHTYSAGGTYNVSLTVTDRGGNRATLTQTIVVLNASGQTVATLPGAPSSGQNGSLQVNLHLTPQSLGAVTRNGLSLRVRSNRAANGIVSISISRAAAKRAHIRVGRGPSVVIARGTTAAIRNGVITLRLGLPRSVAAKLKRLGHVTFTVRLSVVAAGGSRLAVDAAGRY
jgi:hypothetical protein